MEEKYFRQFQSEKTYARMTIILKATTQGTVNKAINTLGRQRRFPETTSKAMMRWGKTLERDLKNSLRESGVRPFTGTLQGNGIRYEQKPNGTVGKLFIRSYGVQLDSMRPHYVQLKKSRTTLTKWASQANSGEIREMSVQVKQSNAQPTIHVKPHPFIRKGYNRARKKLPAILREESDKAIKR